MQQDLEVNQLKDANNTVLKRLKSMINEYADMAPNIRKYTTEYSINLAKSQSTLSSFSSMSSLSSTDSSARSISVQMNPVMVKKVNISFN